MPTCSQNCNSTPTFASYNREINQGEVKFSCGHAQYTNLDVIIETLKAMRK